MKPMNNKYLITIAALAALTMPAMRIAAAEDKAASSDAMFIKHAADANMTEIKLGKLAAENGEKQSVKDFGNKMVTDHGQAGDQLQPIAKKLNVQLSNELSSEHQKTVDRLSKLEGAAFDKAYSEAMLMDHKKVIAMFESEEESAKDSELKKFVSDTLPTLKEHLSMAEKLESK
jgi:putative membrane protein